MNIMITSVGAALFYLLGLAAQWLRVVDSNVRRGWVLFLAFVGVLFQTGALYLVIRSDQGVNLNPLNILSLIALMVTLVVVLSSLRKPAESLLIVALPFAVLSVLAMWLVPMYRLFPAPGLMVFHVLLSALAYGLLMVAMCQMMLLAYQEHQLRHHNRRRVVKALPPLQTMEKLVFEFLLLGVILLTLSLVTGFVYIDDMFAQPMVHKTLLSLVSWMLFTTLLVGRWLFGWRGRRAARWIVSGFVLLCLAYFGWRMVVDFLMGL